jgi:hypothetical protein
MARAQRSLQPQKRKAVKKRSQRDKLMEGDFIIGSAAAFASG